MDFLYKNFAAVTWQQVVMWLVGCILIWLAIRKNMEPALLLPMGFGAILVNIPFSGAINGSVGGEPVAGILDSLFSVGIPILFRYWIEAFTPISSSRRTAVVFSELRTAVLMVTSP